jgi:hypothetical protein
VALALLASLATSAPARPARTATVIQLSYGETPGQDGPDRVLEAFSRRTDSLKFHTTFKGEHVTSPGRYDPNVTDTDIHGNRAKHPWKPNRRLRGSRLISLVHRSLNQRGFARVTVRATNKRTGTDIVQVEIDLSSSDCTLDPPLYPISCEVPAARRLSDTSSARRPEADPARRQGLRRISAAGVGRVKLGTPFARLHQDGLVGPMRKGCELDPGSRSARLKGPLEGQVDLAKRGGRRIASVITVTGGVHARRVKIGSNRRRVRRSYPGANFRHSTDDVFGITLVNVPRGDGGRLQMGISVDTKRVVVFAVPHLAFCE